jgi:hypothetical protein
MSQLKVDNSVASIFFSYVRPDQVRVLPFFDYLQTQGFDVWMDCRKLKPGQNWEYEIKRALDQATFVIVFVSQNSYDKRGYVQRELKLALDKHTERLVDDIYIIPVLLDDEVQMPEQFRKFQSITASELDSNERIVDALNHQLTRLGLSNIYTLQLEDSGKQFEAEETERPVSAGTKETAPWKGLLQLSSILQHLSEPQEAFKHYCRGVDYLVKNQKWSYTTTFAYPPELVELERDLNALILRFADELRAAAKEVKQAADDLYPSIGIFKAIGENPFEILHKSLLAAAQNVDGIRVLRESARSGSSLEALESSLEFQRATTSLNAIVHAIEVVDEKERANTALFNAFMNRNN